MELKDILVRMLLIWFKILQSQLQLLSKYWQIICIWVKYLGQIGSVAKFENQTRTSLLNSKYLRLLLPLIP